ncbi:MAG TPA: lysine--tRNA ligase [Candidatus Limnocylindria bacterium]|nr:lysine--tRNA ligase [Candidatus Limnocylindria bacterium]
MTSGHEAAFWADEEMKLLDPRRPHVVRDSKTPSGPSTIGSLRGPVISDALYRTFKGAGLDVRFVYTIDDYDPMDSQSMKERAGMAEHMGKPLCAIPSPDPSAASDFAEYHAARFIALFAGLGITPEFHRMRDLYRSGALDRQIDLVLRNAETIRAIHKRVANVDHPEGWLPISVICENCGRIGTTLATEYDGHTVTYVCRTDYVDWAEGCGHGGRISPFKGNSKLLWNEQWCAQWDHFGVTYEEGGKDLLTAGGSRDRSNAIYREVFGKEPPAGLAHEFFNFGGKKMATSKGLGATAVEIAEIYPPEITRFLMLRTHPNRHIEFDPAGMTLPRLVDEYDRFADAYLADTESDMGKTWRLSQVSPPREPPGFRVRFQVLADWLQIPSIKPDAEAEKRKGVRLTAPELRDLHRRLELARIWLDRWAPEDAKFTVLPHKPDVQLSDLQRRYLVAIKNLIGSVHDPEEMQNQLYEWAKKVGLVNAEGKPAREAFAAIYLAFIGKPNGPKAGWLLTSLETAFVLRRLDEMGRD